VSPFLGKRADILIVHPLQAMQVGTRLGVHDSGSQLANGRVVAIEQHERGPVFARIDGLDLAFHFCGFSGAIVVLHAINSFRGVRELEQLGHVAKP
jgi:hypothetical protein